MPDVVEPLTFYLHSPSPSYPQLTSNQTLGTKPSNQTLGNKASNATLGDRPSTTGGASQAGPNGSRRDLLKFEVDNDDTFIVDWDGPYDLEKPTNISFARKLIATVCLGLMTLSFAFASSVFAPATLVTAEQFGVSSEVMTLGTSLFVLGMCVGPTIWGPFSELYGRKFPMFLSFTVLAIFQIPAAVAQDVQSLIIFRFFQGFLGSAPAVIPGGILADIWDARERGFALPAYAGALFVGPMLAPIIGAYIVDSKLGWRWTQWITLIMAALFGGIGLFVIPETFGPVILAKRAKRIRFRTKNWAMHAKHEEKEINFSQIAHTYLLRPVKMLAMEPILTLVTLYLAFITGLLYLLFDAFPISFAGQRGWSAGVAALPFLSVLIGILIACGLLMTTTRTRLTPNIHEGRPQETRLLLMIVGGVCLPIGLFWFAWTSSPHISPWPQIISGIPIGFGMMIITLQGINYLIDCYTIYAASAIAGTTLIRNLFGAAFPLFSTYMFQNVGVPWGASILGFIAVALMPVPVVFYIFGARIRKWSTFVPS